MRVKIGVCEPPLSNGFCLQLGETPEELFTNICTDEVEYPEGDEALDAGAESLIASLLEKAPTERLGTVGDAVEVAAHPFFATLDFRSLLRQKAEFVPQLADEEDTSYFDARTDRYNHDAESGDEEVAAVAASAPAMASAAASTASAGAMAASPQFWSFSTASPRHSIVAHEIPSAQLAALRLTAATAGASSPQQSTTPTTSFDDRQPKEAAATNSSTHSTSGVDDMTAPAAAIILRQRFSAQRHANNSTSSSGTGGPICSSTDSSIDASYLLGETPTRHTTTSISLLPRVAISSCDAPAATTSPPPQPRRATLCVAGGSKTVASRSTNAAATSRSPDASPNCKPFAEDERPQKWHLAAERRRASTFFLGSKNCLLVCSCFDIGDGGGGDFALADAASKRQHKHARLQPGRGLARGSLLRADAAARSLAHGGVVVHRQAVVTSTARHQRCRGAIALATAAGLLAGRCIASRDVAAAAGRVVGRRMRGKADRDPVGWVARAHKRRLALAKARAAMALRCARCASICPNAPTITPSSTSSPPSTPTRRPTSRVSARTISSRM